MHTTDAMLLFRKGRGPAGLANCPSPHRRSVPDNCDKADALAGRWGPRDPSRPLKPGTEYATGSPSAGTCQALS